MTDAVVELEGLCVRFGRRRVLQDLTVSLSQGVIGLLGPNGAGKSTLIRTLLGFCPIAGGRARVLGFDVQRRGRCVRAGIGYMPENDAFIADMAGVTFVRMMGELAGLPRAAALERAHEVLFYVGLGEARYRKLGTYSLGMKQMAKLAQAIVHGPRLLILDEPTNGLDPSTRRRMLRLIREIHVAGATRILLCSHLLRDVEETCHEVLILKDGRIVHHADLAAERGDGQRLVEVETPGAEEAVLPALESLGVPCTALGRGRFRLVWPAERGLRDLYRVADREDWPLRRVVPHRDTLEEIFLQAMEEV